MNEGLTSGSTRYSVFLCFCAFVCTTDFSFQFSYHLAFAARACRTKIKATLFTYLCRQCRRNRKC